MLFRCTYAVSRGAPAAEQQQSPTSAAAAAAAGSTEIRNKD